MAVRLWYKFYFQTICEFVKINLILCWFLDFPANDIISYIDDLNTLKLIVDAIAAKTSKQNWSIIGADITIGSVEKEAKLYAEFSKSVVEAVGWSQ